MIENEDILIKECIDWNAPAQNRLYNLFASKMFAVCMRYSKNREEAEDILHEGFMKVFQNINKFRKEGSLEGWVRKIMFNTAIEKYRKRKAEGISEVSIDNLNTDLNNYSNEDILSNIGVNELIQIIQKLPPRYQLVFNLYAFEGLKHREIAEKLGISEGTSKSNLFDARAILQKEINSRLRVPVSSTSEDGRK